VVNPDNDRSQQCFFHAVIDNRSEASDSHSDSHTICGNRLDRGFLACYLAGRGKWLPSHRFACAHRGLAVLVEAKSRNQMKYLKNKTPAQDIRY
jgi:hypothetical protein